MENRHTHLSLVEQVDKKDLEAQLAADAAAARRWAAESARYNQAAFKGAASLRPVHPVDAVRKIINEAAPAPIELDNSFWARLVRLINRRKNAK